MASEEEKDKIEYGFDAVPLGFASYRCDAALWQWLNECALFDDEQTPERALAPAYGFSKCIDYPALVDKHIYYEGYFHGCRTAAPIDSICPRNGRSMAKRAAPKRLRAFIVAMRELNAERLTKFSELLAAEDDEDGSVCRLFAPLFSAKNEAAFGDLAVQMHWGHEVVGPNGDNGYGNLGWHRDSRNSVLHAALSIRGKRALHSCRFATPEAAEQCDGSQSMKALGCADWRQPGDIYVASPAYFYHAVEYPQNDAFEQRVIAVQSRMLLSRLEYNLIYSVVRNAGSEAERLFGQHVAEFIGGGGIAMPSFDHVKAIFDELGDDDTKESAQSSASDDDDDEAKESSATDDDNETAPLQTKTGDTIARIAQVEEKRIADRVARARERREAAKSSESAENSSESNENKSCLVQ
jgi:hypothetical protein